MGPIPVLPAWSETTLICVGLQSVQRLSALLNTWNCLVLQLLVPVLCHRMHVTTCCCCSQSVVQMLTISLIGQIVILRTLTHPPLALSQSLAAVLLLPHYRKTRDWGKRASIGVDPDLPEPGMSCLHWSPRSLSLGSKRRRDSPSSDGYSNLHLDT